MNATRSPIDEPPGDHAAAAVPEDDQRADAADDVHHRHDEAAHAREAEALLLEALVQHA